MLDLDERSEGGNVDPHRGRRSADAAASRSATRANPPAPVGTWAALLLAARDLAGATPTLAADSKAASATPEPPIKRNAPALDKMPFDTVVATWNSYDAVLVDGDPQGVIVDGIGKKKAELEFYESIDDGGVERGPGLSLFVPGAHPEEFNHVEKYWRYDDGPPYPYVGKSSVERGKGEAETGMPQPLGVRDLQAYPPNNEHSMVVAFIAPVAGSYSATEY